jgi:hypothetical protein
MNKNIPNNKSAYIQKLLKEEEIDNVLVTPVGLEKNPYEHFGIYDSKGKIDLVRIERIRQTHYYKHYCSFRNFHKLDEKEIDDKLEYFFDNYDSLTEYEDQTYVDQGIDIWSNNIIAF